MEDGRVYYEHGAFDKTQWEKPTASSSSSAEETEELSIKMAAPQSTTSTNLESSLPEGWIEHETEDGQPYYEHCASNTIQWEKPTTSSSSSTEETQELSIKMTAPQSTTSTNLESSLPDG